jgi:hypothetical protein
MNSLLLLLANEKFSLASLLDRPGYDEENLAKLKLFLALLTLVVLFYESSRDAEGNPVPQRIKKIAGGVLAVAGVISYFQFFQIGYKEFYHRWEFFHYYMGAKYFKEIGFEGIYTCAAVAENDLGFVKDAKARKLRDLRVNLIVSSEEWIKHPEKCKDGFERPFSPEKWESFKQDVAFFRRVSLGNYWVDMQKDHGYNPPPAWGLTGWIFANLHPAVEWYMKLLSCLDIMLFAGMFGLIAWAFGWRVMVVAIVFWGTQDASPFYWTGGAFLRQDWLFYLVASACMVRKQKYFWGGFFMTYSTLLRVFPLFFFLGWFVVIAAQLYKKRTLLDSHKKLILGAVTSGVILIAASSAVHGVKAWPSFISHIAVHNGTPLTNHMGWKTIVAHQADGRMQVAKDPKLQDPFEGWKNMRRARVKHLAPIYYGGILAMAACFAYACWRIKNLWIVQALGCLMTTICVELTCYYYSYFILGALLTKGRKQIEYALLICAALTEIFHLNYGWFDDRFTAMSIPFVVLGLFMVLIYMRNPWISVEEAKARAKAAMDPYPLEEPAES